MECLRRLVYFMKLVKVHTEVLIIVSIEVAIAFSICSNVLLLKVAFRDKQGIGKIQREN